MVRGPFVIGFERGTVRIWTEKERITGLIPPSWQERDGVEKIRWADNEDGDDQEEEKSNSRNRNEDEWDGKERGEESVWKGLDGIERAGKGSHQV